MKHLYTFLILLLSSTYFAQTATDGLYFDGIDDNISVPGTTNINSKVTNNRTYEMSFKVINAASSTKQIIMKEGGYIRAVIIYVENGYLYLGAYNQADYTPKWAGTFYRKPISSNTWYHLAFVFDNAQPGNASTNPMNASANNALKWYLDGSLMGEISGYQLGNHSFINLGYKDQSLDFPTCGTWTTTGTSEYCFGTNANDNGRNEYYFNGYIWGYRVWNDVRTPAEINSNRSNIINTVGTDDLVAALDGDSFSYLDSNDNVQEATVSAAATISWKATATTTNWNTASNWVGGVIPDPAKKQGVRIVSSTNYPVINSHIVTGDLTINNAASITINQGGTIEVAYDITNNGVITVNDSGSLILRKKTTSSGSGTFNVLRKTPTYTGTGFYSYWSSPVVEANSNPGTIFSDASYIYYFNSSTTGADWAINGGANFKPGTGYAVRNESTGGSIRTFGGIVNQGDVAANVYFNTNIESEDTSNVWSTEGDNLVGNPYASAIDWDLVITDPDNSFIDGTIFYWDQTSAEVGENNVSDYKYYNLTGGSSNTATGKIGTGQGFFIKVPNNGTITFKPTHQIAANNTQFFKGSNSKNNKKEGRSWFKLSNGEEINTLLIGFVDGATDELDRLYDSPFDINQEHLGFYSLAGDDKKAAIQGLPILTKPEKIVKLGFIVDKIGDYSLSIQEEHIDSAYHMYLKDNEKDSIIDLKLDAYHFTIDQIGENNTRFELIYTQNNRESLNVTSEVKASLSNFNVFVNEEKELIATYNFDANKIKKISIYNIVGREIITYTGTQTKKTSNLATGIYLIKATLLDNRTIAKKIVITN